jgi:hypothetical protein
LLSRELQGPQGQGLDAARSYTWRASKNSRSPICTSLRLGLIRCGSDLYFS